MSDEMTEEELRAFLHDVIENKSMANEWLQTAIPALGGNAPMQLMTSASGRLQIEQVLKRMLHGDIIG